MWVLGIAFADKTTSPVDKPDPATTTWLTLMHAARIVVLLSALAAQQTTAFDPLKTVARDLAALRMRSTARHIMRPKTPDGRGQCGDDDDM